MDAKEHILIVHMLAQQNLFLKQLCDAIKSGVPLTDEDIKLFGDFLLSDPGIAQAIVRRTLLRYLEEAGKLGVVTGLEEIPGMLPTPGET
jgi:hypothetical protein